MEYALVAILAIVISCVGTTFDFTGLHVQSRVATTAKASGAHRLTVKGQTELHSLLDSAELADLRLPNFANEQKEAREFYSSFDDALPWLQGSRPTPQAHAIIAILKDAERRGLEPEDYDGPRWDGRVAVLEQSNPPSESDLIRFDVAVTVSVMRYISDLHIGRVNPRLFHFELDLDHKAIDLSEFLEQKLVTAHDVQSAINTAEPPFPAYHRTVAALKKYLELARQDDAEPLPVPRESVKPGAAYAGVPRLKRLLELLGDLSQTAGRGSSESVYRGNLVDAVKHFQQRHGLEPNGQIDDPTLKELNIPMRRRVLQLKLTLERWRWVPHQFVRPPVVVNIPEFRLHADDAQYRWILSMKVVVGKAYYHQTPVFASALRSVIFRPYWNVPLEIQQNEILPDIAKNRSYLTEHSYEVVDPLGHVVTEAVISDEMEQQLRDGTLGLRQKPGPDNALGLVKFDFPNPYDVYMHGTPETELFSKSRRDFSHGCIRVEDPVTLAAWVLKDEAGWNKEKIRAAMNGDQTIRVNLQKAIPVLIVYGTAVVMEDGEIRFFDDVYGYDAELALALEKGHPYTP